MRKHLFLIFALAVILVGCKRAPEPRTISLSEGIEIPLILARNIEAGKDAKGTTVPFIVSQDVTAPDQTVVVPKGTVCYGKVIWSRNEGTLSAVMNQPARLDIRIDYVTLKDGQKVNLAIEPGQDTDTYEFTRANTGKVDESPEALQAWSDTEKQKLMTTLIQLIDRSKKSDLSNDPQTDELLTRISKDLNLSYSGLEKGSKERVSSLLGTIGNGELNIDKLAKAALPEITALIELTKLTGFVGKQIGGVLKGRTIKAYMGTPVTVYTKSTQQFTIMPEEAS